MTTAARVTNLSECAEILALIQAAFAYMDGRIDPPSSMLRLTEAEVRAQATAGEIWRIQEAAAIVAAVVLTPRQDCLYLGKLSVRADKRGCGHARTLVETAMARARAHGLPAVELQTRIELTENHATFRALGFRETARTAHTGYDRPTSITMRRDVE